MADEVPFSEKFTELEQLPKRHPLRVREEMAAENPLAMQVLGDFYRVRSHQAPELEQTWEVREWMGHYAAAFERIQTGFTLAALRKPGL